jgi:Trk K+ transport system NAD-binding subunit
MDTLSETADKVDQSLQNMGIDGTSVKQSIRDFLDFKEYLAEQLPAFTGFCIKVVLSIIVFFVGRKIICWIVSIMRRSMERANVDAGVVQFISSAGKAILYTLLIFNIAISLGVKESSVAALLGTAGVTVGLALQGGLANLAGGVLLLMFKPFVVGDYIIQDQANGCEGTVSKIEICYTTLLSIDNKKIGLKTHQVRNTLIIGGGTISYYLAKTLSDLKINVKIIEKDKERCEELSDMLPEATIICGDGTERSLLMEEGLATVESFVTLTNMDEENIFLSLSAKKLTNAKLVAKVNRLPYKDVIDDLDLGSVIYPKYITSDSILRYVRAMQNTIGSNVETLYHVLDNQAEALEFIIRDNSPVVGIPLAELNLKSNLLVCCLTHKGTVRIPRGQDTLQIGDNVVIVTTNKGLRDIRDILA